MVKCEICGREFNAIHWKHLRKHGLMIAEYRKMGYTTDEKDIYPYRDRDTLHSLYWDNELSQPEIASKFGVDVHTICHWMQKLDIPKRDLKTALHKSKANYVDLSPEAISFISGHVLGDGSIVRKRTHSALFMLSSKHRAYLEWTRDQLLSYGIETVGAIAERETAIRDFTGVGYTLKTRAYAELSELQEKWYGSGRKQPPRDLVLDGLALREWFMDDGCFTHENSSGKRNSLFLANYAFSWESKDFLAEQLAGLGLGCTIYPECIRILAAYIDQFFQLLGPCPVPEVFGYKWPSEAESGGQLQLPLMPQPTPWSRRRGLMVSSPIPKKNRS